MKSNEIKVITKDNKEHIIGHGMGMNKRQLIKHIMDFGIDYMEDNKKSICTFDCFKSIIINE